jgi:hypothetical protein
MEHGENRVRRGRAGSQLGFSCDNRKGHSCRSRSHPQGSGPPCMAFVKRARLRARVYRSKSAGTIMKTFW